MQVWRQHALITGHIDTGKTVSIEYPGVEVNFTQRQLGGLYRQRLIGIDLVPVETAVVLVGLLVGVDLIVSAQSPGIQFGTQPTLNIEVFSGVVIVALLAELAAEAVV